jgi:hypothetical protein
MMDEGEHRTLRFSNIVPALQNAITNKALFHQRERYTIFQTTLNTPRHDDILYIADLHNAYHQTPDSKTNEARRQMARLNIYVKDVAKRDVTKLHSYTRYLPFEQLNW